MAGFFESIFPAALGTYGYSELMGDVDAQRAALGPALEGIKSDITSNTQFQPVTTRGPVGSTGYNPATGEMNYTMNQSQQDMMNQLRSQGRQAYNRSMSMDPLMSGAARGYQSGSNMAMMRALQNPGQREQDVYNRIRATQRPEEQRQMNQMNSNLFGSGRGGMMSSDFGGSPEQFAFEKARGETMNQAMLSAMGQAQNEMMNQGQLAGEFGRLGQGAFGQGIAGQQMYGQLGGQMLQNQYLPMEQLRQNMAQSLQGGQLQQGYDLNRAKMLAELGLGGLGTDVNYANIQGNMMGNMVGALSPLLGGIGGSIDSAIDNAGGFGEILKLIGIG